jgi:hypothetical protein
MRVHTAPLNANRRPCMSARSRIDVGNVTPMAFAVLKLTANSKFETCSTGRSAGAVPCGTLATSEAARR